MTLRAHYFKITDTCLYCGDSNALICRATVRDGKLRGIAIMCEPCGIQERDVAIDEGVYEIPRDTYWHQMHNRGEKN
jgi:transcription elongation factor Elf1